MMNLCCKRFILEDLEINEDIDLYQNCLDSDDKGFTEKEEQNMRTFGIQTISDETLKQMRESQMQENMHLQGVHCYDILRNPIYQEQFQYFSADNAARESMIIDADDEEGNDQYQSDLVRIALYLAFIRKGEAADMKFDSKSIMKMKTDNH